MQADDSRTNDRHVWLLRAAGLLAILTTAALMVGSFGGWRVFGASFHVWTIIPPVIGGVLLLWPGGSVRKSAIGAFLVLLGVLPFMAGSGSPAYLPVLALLGVGMLLKLRGGTRLYFVTLEQKIAREVLIVFGAALLAPVLLALLQLRVTPVTFVVAVAALYAPRVVVWAWQAVTTEPKEQGQ